MLPTVLWEPVLPPYITEEVPQELLQTEVICVIIRSCASKLHSDKNREIKIVNQNVVSTMDPRNSAAHWHMTHRVWLIQSEFGNESESVISNGILQSCNLFSMQNTACSSYFTSSPTKRSQGRGLLNRTTTGLIYHRIAKFISYDLCIRTLHAIVFSLMNVSSFGLLEHKFVLFTLKRLKFFSVWWSTYRRRKKKA